MKILGIIPARGGSKSVPRKNIKDLGGKPLIAWTIEAAKVSGVFDRILCSTDDQEIVDVAKRYGAEVPFIRPAELAQDTTPTLPVLQHAVSWLKENEKYEPDAVMILQPTTPFRTAKHLRDTVGLFKKTKSDSVVSVVETPGNYHPNWVFRPLDSNRAELFLGGPIKTRIKRRQDLPKAYSPNGMIYLFKTQLLFDPEDPNFYGDNVSIYIVPEKESVNIDSPEDWTLAEYQVRGLGL